MYTVCWTSDSQDRWERCEGLREVIALLECEGLKDDCDVLIFPPDADEMVMTVEEIEALTTGFGGSAETDNIT